MKTFLPKPCYILSFPSFSFHKLTGAHLHNLTPTVGKTATNAAAKVKLGLRIRKHFQSSSSTQTFASQFEFFTFEFENSSSVGLILIKFTLSSSSFYRVRISSNNFCRV